MTNVTVVNGAGPTDGISATARMHALGLASLGYSVAWYQCVDYGQAWAVDPPFLAGRVDGLGVPNATLDMGINRLWTYPRRLRRLDGDVLLLMDPTLVDVSRSHPHRLVEVHDLRPLGPYSDRRLTRWMFLHVLPQLRQVPRVIVPSRAVAQETIAAGAREDRISIVPNVSAFGTHPEHIDESVRRVTERGVIQVLCVSTDRPYKNLRCVVEVARRCEQLEGSPRFEFTILSRLRAATARWIASQQVRNLRVVPGVPDVRVLLEGTDLLIHPSRYEGFGIPVVEAMGYGIPVVASRIPVMSEILGAAGLLADPENAAEWVSAVQQLRDPAQLAAWGRRCLARSDEYSLDRHRVALAAAVQAS